MDAPSNEPQKYLLCVVVLNADIYGIYFAHEDRAEDVLIQIGTTYADKMAEVAREHEVVFGGLAIGLASLSGKPIAEFTAAEVASLELPMDRLIGQEEALPIIARIDAHLKLKKRGADGPVN